MRYRYYVEKQPIDLDAKKLLGANDLPPCWDRQEQLSLGVQS